MEAATVVPKKLLAVYEYAHFVNVSLELRCPVTKDGFKTLY